MLEVHGAAHARLGTRTTASTTSAAASFFIAASHAGLQACCSTAPRRCLDQQHHQLRLQDAGRVANRGRDLDECCSGPTVNIYSVRSRPGVAAPASPPCGARLLKRQRSWKSGTNTRTLERPGQQQLSSSVSQE